MVDKCWFIGLVSLVVVGLMMFFVWVFVDGNLGWDGN